jgi:hypothetical protein
MSTRKGKGVTKGRKPAAPLGASGGGAEIEEIKAASDRDIDIPPKEDLIAGQIRPQTSLGRGPPTSWGRRDGEQYARSSNVSTNSLRTGRTFFVSSTLGRGIIRAFAEATRRPRCKPKPTRKDFS